jgi:hypothetical protein
LQEGDVGQVVDFGQNLLCEAQDAPQALHWDHQQAVIHPVVNHYRNKDGVLVTEEHVMITDDLKHDAYAVKEFERISIAELQKRTEVKRIIQWCDNCPNQYKSKGPFQLVSQSKIPMIRMFYGERHGKSEADGAIGRAKAAAQRARLSRQAVILTAKDFYNFCVKSFARNNPDTNTDPNKKFFQKFFWVPKIPRKTPIVAVTTPDTRQFHQLRSTGRSCTLEVRFVGCLCPNCLNSDGQKCENKHYTAAWRPVDLETGKVLPSIRNQHWGGQSTRRKKRN